MTIKRGVLQIGTKIILKGTNSKDDKVGVITEYLTDENTVISGYTVKPTDNSFLVMAIALDDDIEVLKQITVKCPWCAKPFPIDIEDKYKGANAIPQDGNLPVFEGFDSPCPNCTRQLFIHCYK